MQCQTERTPILDHNYSNTSKIVLTADRHN